MIEFLLELSIGVHRYAMYPPGHPSLAPTVANIRARLAPVVDQEETLSIGVGRRELLIDDTATDPDHPVLSDLARRLHEQNLGGIVVRAGVGEGEVADFLGVLAERTGPRAEPLGLLPPEEIPEWPHLRLVPLGLAHLTLAEEGPGAGGTGAMEELWRGLARDALTRARSLDAGGPAEVEEVSRAIAEGVEDAAYARRVGGYVRRLTAQLQRETGEEAEKVRERLVRLVQGLDETSLRKVVAGAVAEGSGGVQELTLDATRALTPGAAVRVLEAAARSSGQHISHSLTRLLSKLAVHAEHGSERVAREAGYAVRENVEALVGAWDLQAANPEQYDTLLDALSSSVPAFGGRVRRRPEVGGAERILDMALEVGSFGPTVGGAVEDLVRRGQGARVLERIAEVPEESEAVEGILAGLVRPALLRLLLAGDSVPDDLLDDLIRRLGQRALDPLLDVLADSDSRTIRTRVVRLLPHLGDRVGERAAERLRDDRWHVVRNMLALLRHLPGLPDGVEVLVYQRHPDHRVRREAFQLAVRDPGRRSRALGTALTDPDDRLVQMAMLEMGDSVPEALEPVLVQRVLEADRDPQVRALAARALAGRRSVLVRDALLGAVVAGRTLLGRVRLADDDPAVRAALAALRSGWASDPEVAPVLEAARGSKEAGLREAVHPSGRDER